jgi:diguanylate cyclase
MMNMNKINLYRMSDSAMAEFSGDVHRQESFENPVYGNLQNCLSELAEFKQTLAASQQQLKAAQLQIETLLGNETRLRQKLIWLAKKYAHARHFGYHDELTGLPNRSLLLDRLKQAIFQSARCHKQVALLFIDVGKFKNVNDRFGHVAGDKLLQLVADRLTACIRYVDTACRYGGDEFVIMLPEIDGQENVALVTEKIRAHLSTPYVLNSNVITVTASIGTAFYRAGGQDCRDLIKQADIDMYRAKVRSNAPSQSF